MTDITININTGSDSSEPKVTTTTDNATVAVSKEKLPKVETPKVETKVETPKVETKEETPKEEMKEETPKEEMKEETPKDKSAKKGDSNQMDMTKEEHAKMDSKK